MKRFAKGTFKTHGTDHKPGRADERARIEAAGGFVTQTAKDIFRASAVSPQELLRQQASAKAYPPPLYVYSRSVHDSYRISHCDFSSLIYGYVLINISTIMLYIDQRTSAFHHVAWIDTLDRHFSVLFIIPSWLSLVRSAILS
jgi:hypothetical protein